MYARCVRASCAAGSNSAPAIPPRHRGPEEDQMAVRPSPTVRRKRLGIELRRLREQSGLTCEEVGRKLDCSGTRVSRVETSVISVKPGDVRELLEVYGIEGEEADALVQLARDA